MSSVTWCAAGNTMGSRVKTLWDLQVVFLVHLLVAGLARGVEHAAGSAVDLPTKAPLTKV